LSATAHITMIIDRSGSMIKTGPDAEGGVNAYIAEQRQLPDIDITVSIFQFDGVFETVADNVPIDEVEPYRLQPRGNTALYDAMAKGVLATPRGRDKTIVVVVTDGEENASVEWKGKKALDALLEDKRKLGWEIIFLASEPLTVELGRELHLNTSRYSNTREGTQAVYASASGATQSYLRGETQTVVMPDEVDE